MTTIELLKVIIMACTTSAAGGASSNTVQDTTKQILKVQRECQKQLIECVYAYDDDQKTKGIVNCLKKG